ncbi:MAG: hypothetical protein R3C53_10170 [Pirellulaceae bacterium]
MRLQPSLTILALCTAFLCSFAPRVQAQEPAEASPTSWVSADGRAVAAEFVRLTEDGVILRLTTSGKEVAVPFASLSLESHLQALKLADPEAFSKPLVKAPVKTIVEDYVPEGQAFTSDEILISPFVAGTSLEQFLDKGIAEIKRGNMFVVWHALPPRMQNDLEDVMVKAMGNLGKQPIVQLRVLLGSLSGIVHEQRDFIFGYPAVAAQPEVIAEMEPDWPKLAGFMTQISDESKWQVENFEKGKIIPWLAKFAADVAPYADTDEVQEFDIQYKIISQSADRATVEFTLSGLPPTAPAVPPTTLDLQKVGDIWLVPTWMNELRRGVDQAKQGLDNAAGSMAMLPMMMTPVVAAVQSVERAETQLEFNAAVDAILGLFQGMAPPGGGGPMAGGPGGPRPGLPAMNPGANSGGGAPPPGQPPRRQGVDAAVGS